MLKSGLIVGFAALLAGFGAALVSPLCTPCVAVAAGLVTGYLAGWFDKPDDRRTSAKSGAGGGAIAGIGGLLGSLIAAGTNALVLGPGGAAQFARQLGLPTGSVGDASTFAASYYVSTIALAGWCGLLNIALMAGLGALGGILWYQVSDKQTAA